MEGQQKEVVPTARRFPERCNTELEKGYGNGVVQSSSAAPSRWPER